MGWPKRAPSQSTWRHGACVCISMRGSAHASRRGSDFCPVFRSQILYRLLDTNTVPVIAHPRKTYGIWHHAPYIPLETGLEISTVFRAGNHYRIGQPFAYIFCNASYKKHMTATPPRAPSPARQPPPPPPLPLHASPSSMSGRHSVVLCSRRMYRNAVQPYRRAASPAHGVVNCLISTRYYAI